VIETYKAEARNLRAQMDAQRPDKIMEMQGDLRMKADETERLREEIRTLKVGAPRGARRGGDGGRGRSAVLSARHVAQVLVGRQERSLKESNVQDEDYAAKVQGFLGDLQVRAQPAGGM
jgi:hypothetical protein